MLTSAVVVVLVLDNMVFASERQKDVGKPNIVFVLADDYGFSDIGYHGSKIKTPNLDKLADSGVRLENYYVQPICSPTRFQFLSGRSTIHLGHQHSVLLRCQPFGLPFDSETLPWKLREAGYATHAVGKWHLGFYQNRYLPHNRGFDTFYGFLTGNGDHYGHTSTYNGTEYIDLRDEKGPITTETGHYSTHLFTEKAIDVVRSLNKRKPFFLYLAYQAPHYPMEVPERYTVPYAHFTDETRRIYAGMVAAMDEGIGNLTQVLKDQGLWDNTIFVFSTDNGGSPNYGGYNYPLRGMKFTYWEGGVRGIGFVTSGKNIDLPRGRVSHDLFDVTDWFPTFVELAGGNFNGTRLDGFNQWNALKGAASPRQHVLHVIDTMEKKLGQRVHNDTFDNRILAAIRIGNYKLLTGRQGMSRTFSPPEENNSYVASQDETRTGKNIWLYNIKEDPNENIDLADQRTDLVKEMLDILQDYQATAVPPQFPYCEPSSNPARHGGVWGPWE